MQFCTTIFSSMVSGIISFIVERIFFVNSTQNENAYAIAWAFLFWTHCAESDVPIGGEAAVRVAPPEKSTSAMESSHKEV